MARHILSIVAFVGATFVTQAISHFAVNTEHYAAVPYLRREPIFSLGVAAMLIQGAILSYLYVPLRSRYGTEAAAVKFAWLAGAFLLSYTALAEAAKYTVPAIGSWIVVEVVAGFVQFTLYGVLLGLVYRQTRPKAIAP